MVKGQIMTHFPYYGCFFKNNQKVCEVCKMKNNKKNTQKKLENSDKSKNCKACGNLFTPKKKGDLFCCPDCEKQWNTVKPAKIEKIPDYNDPWKSGRFSQDITANQFDGMFI